MDGENSHGILWDFMGFHGILMACRCDRKQKGEVLMVCRCDRKTKGEVLMIDECGGRVGWVWGVACPRVSRMWPWSLIPPYISLSL